MVSKSGEVIVLLSSAEYSGSSVSPEVPQMKSMMLRKWREDYQGDSEPWEPQEMRRDEGFRLFQSAQKKRQRGHLIETCSFLRTSSGDCGNGLLFVADC